MTGGRLVGPASAYPMLRRPALICLIEANDVCALGCASAEPDMPSCAAVRAMAAEVKEAAAVLVDWFGEIALFHC